MDKENAWEKSRKSVKSILLGTKTELLFVVVVQKIKELVLT